MSWKKNINLQNKYANNSKYLTSLTMKNPNLNSFDITFPILNWQTFINYNNNCDEDLVRQTITIKLWYFGNFL